MPSETRTELPNEFSLEKSWVPEGGALQARYLEEIYSSRNKGRPGFLVRLKSSFHLQFLEESKDQDLSQYCKEKRIGEIRQTSHSGPTQAELIQASLRRKNSIAQGSPRTNDSPIKTDEPSPIMKREGRNYLSSPAMIDADEHIHSRWEQCQEAMNADDIDDEFGNKLDEDSSIDNVSDQERLPGSLQAAYLSEAMKSQNVSIVSTSPPCRPIPPAPKEFGAQPVGCGLHDLQGNTGVLQASALERALHRRRSTIIERRFGWWRS